MSSLRRASHHRQLCVSVHVNESTPRASRQRANIAPPTGLWTRAGVPRFRRQHHHDRGHPTPRNVKLGAVLQHFRRFCKKYTLSGARCTRQHAMQNRVNGEPYIHYLVDERLLCWSKKQRKKYQDRQDSRLYDVMYIDYLNDPEFETWSSELCHEYHERQLRHLRTQHIDWSADARFQDMSPDDRHDLKRSVSRPRRRHPCVLM